MQIRRIQKEDRKQIILLLEQVSRLHIERRPDIFKTKTYEDFDKYALDQDVFNVFPNCDKTEGGNATRKSKIKYFLFKKGISIENADDFIDNDIDNILKLYHTLSDGTHGEAGKYNIIQLKAIKKHVEDGINFLCSIVV